MANRQILNKINLVNILMVVGTAVILRLLPHAPNFAPIGALALFGGAYLNGIFAFVVPLSAMFVSDLFLGFHNTMFFVYGSFILIGLLGLWLKNHKSAGNVILASLSSSVLFFLLTNFGVWLVSGMYQKTASGLMESYFMALPFFRNTLLGDLFYTGVFFGGYEVLKAFTYKVALRFNHE